MLVLARQKDQEIVIGSEGNIVITVLEIRGQTVRLGFSAPDSVPIHRREIFEELRRAGRDHTQADAG